MIPVYNNIKQVAKEVGLPIYLLEQEAQVSRGSICKWNTVSPSVANLKKVADALGVSVERLIEDGKH